ncbi:hypothetical protein B0A52_09392 [Exophiala mesophila]|uniref:Uncharacterized protein n=1 Tax=Exophiala mesophila TaxID=212818 RepID=A0A438MSN3_EXOME|nr:hypothetical protein B0A52_09392 [Exophiala mesophila]
MASIILGAGFLIHHIHDKKQVKRERKRLAYENRYRELEQEYASQKGKIPSGISGHDLAQTSTRPDQNEKSNESLARKSTESAREDLDADPTKWVDDVIRAQKTRGSHP